MAGLQSVGGIPAHTTKCGSTLKPSGGDDTAAINWAIAACSVRRCPSGKYIELGAGRFLIDAVGTPVELNKCITLVGQGPGTTILHSGNGAVLNIPRPGTHIAPIIRAGGSATIGRSTNLSADGAQGAYSVTVASAAGFSVGDMVLIDELGNGQPMPDPAFNGALVAPQATATCSSSGTTLTCTGMTGTIRKWLIPTCSGCAYDVWITGGSGDTWTTSTALGASSATVRFIGSVWAESDYRVVWNQRVPAVRYFDSACVGYANNNDWAASCATNGDECAYSIRCGGVTEELKLIARISGHVITFDSPLTISYRTARTAQLHDYPSSSFVTYAGVENMSLSNGDEGNLVFEGCVYCWAHEVESSQWLNAGGFAFYQGALRDQVDFSWVHDAAWPIYGGAGYAINETYGASENYIFNNIDMLANKVDVVRASGAGTVFAYNYMDDGYINGQDSWVETGMNCSHLAGSHHVLFEGNQSWNSDDDSTHGSTGHCTWFRNWMTGFRAPFTALDGRSVNDTANIPPGVGPLRAIGDNPYSYWNSFVGNVTGTNGAVGSWTLKCARGNANFGCGPVIYTLGWNSSSVSGSEADLVQGIDYPGTITGTITGPGCLASGESCSPIRDGNYDYKSNSIQWASNDTTHVLPNSFYLTAAPAFFSSGSGYPWPWVVPESPTTQLPKGCSGSCAGLPAKARWDAGTPFVQP